MAKKVTAPKTYDPGKGRPKEHLAYLNEREMAYLQSVNGSGPARGPKGLPSFVETSGTKSAGSISDKYSGYGGGWNTSTGSRASSGGYNSGTKGSKGGGASTQAPGAGGNAGQVGGGQGGQNSGMRGAGSNYGPGSGRPGTTPPSGGGYKGPASPMGGQGTSVSRDTEFRQQAQVRDAIAAVKNSPAFRGDAVSGGIKSINVGPMGTPVNVGRVPATSSISQVSRSITAARPSTSISTQFPSYKYNEPLRPGMLSQEDINRRVAEMNRIEQEMRDMGLINKPAVTRTGSPIDAGGVPTQNPNEALKGAGYGTFNAPKVSRDRLGFEALSVPSKELPEPKIPEKIDVNDVYGPVQERVLAVEDVPPETPTYEDDYEPQKYVNISGGLGFSPFNATPQEERLSTTSPTTSLYTSQKNTAARNARYGNPPAAKTRGIGDIANAPAMNRGIESSGEILSEDGYGYPTKEDGSPITAEDIANMPEDVQKEYYDKVRYSREYDKPYPLTSAQKTRGYVASGIGAILNKGLPGLAVKAASLVPGEFGKAAKKLSNPRAAVNEYDRANPLRQQQIKERAGRKSGFGDGTTTTSAGGGKEDIGSGGKNESGLTKPKAKETEKPSKANKAKKSGSSRPEIYYMWDAGVNVPSPKDSDYTLYQQYLAEKRAAQAAFGMR